MNYRVVLTKKAKLRAAEIFDYFAYELCIPMGAERQFNRIMDAVESLNLFPNRFAVLHFEDEGLKEIRRMLVDSYSVFYKVEEEKKRVLILTILYSASDFKQKLISDVEDTEY